MKLNPSDKRMVLIGILLMLGYVAYSILVAHTTTAVATESISSDSIRIPTDTTKTPPLGTATPTPPKEPSPIKTDRYPGPPKRAPQVLKLHNGETIDLNTADTLALQSVPGIGPGFARKIAKYRGLLGGYYVVEQLQEIYGMDRERYDKIKPYFRLAAPVRPLLIGQDSIPYHPYLSYRHRNVLRDLLRKGDPIDWRVLMHSGAFTRDDSLRLAPYLRLPSTSG